MLDAFQLSWWHLIVSLPFIVTTIWISVVLITNEITYFKKDKEKRLERNNR